MSHRAKSIFERSKMNQLAHKIEIKPTKEQLQKLIRACGCARFTYNWALTRWNNLYECWKSDNSQPKPNINLIRKEFNSIKKEKFPWIYESLKDANQRPFSNLDKAFKRFFQNKSKYPKRKKKSGRNSFYISNDKFTIVNKIIFLPKGIGAVKLTQELRFEGKIMSAVISKDAHKWFVSIQVDTNVNKEKEKKIINEVIGIDLGLTHFATLSDGEVIDSPKPLKRSTKLLKKRQRQKDKKVKWSNNRKKSMIKLSRLHFKIKCQRHDFLHKLSTKICRENQTICMEDLKVSNMIKNHCLARAISDAGWGEFRRQIEYKSKLFGNNVTFANTFYPSSKTCSNCGFIKKDLTLKDKVFVCPVCNINIDRDLNASFNLSRV